MVMAAKKFVLYHDNCPDGFTAAWAAWRALGDEATYIPVKYGDPLPAPVKQACEDHAMPIVYILDFSYPRQVLLDLNGEAVVRVLDHHKTAEADLAGLAWCTFDMKRSGAMLAWDYFHRTPAPKLVEYVQDRDLWKFELPDSKEVMAYVMSFEYSFKRWSTISEMLNSYFEDCYEQGQAILRSKDQMVRMMANQARWMVIGGHRVPVVNATVAFSEVGNYLAENLSAPFAAYYFDRADGKRQWGLRSIGDFDVSEIAKKYGGGGHKNAAGFVTEIVDFSVSPR